MDEYKSTFQRIEALAARANDSTVDDLVRAHIAQLICVVASGALESACQSILGAYVDKTARHATVKYAKVQLGRVMNPNPESIESLIGAFDKVWADSLRVYWQGEVRDAINSIVRNRHNIAHGRSTTVTLGQVLPWVKCAKQFCTKLEELVGS
jgi:hypothetical protein